MIINSSIDRYCSFLDSLPQPAFLITEKGKTLYINKRGRYIFQIPEPEASLKTDFPPASAIFQPSAASSGGETGGLLELLNKNEDFYGFCSAAFFSEGETIEIRLNGSLLETKEGIQAYLITLEETGLEHEKSETKQVQTANRLAAVIESSPLAIMTFSADGLVTSWNKASENIYGFSKEETIGKYLPTVRGAQRADFEEGLRKALSGKLVYDHESWRFRKNGELVLMSLYMAPIYGSEGEITEVIGMGMDITEKKRNENLVKESLEEKKLLLKEIHHRVKNNLQIVSSLLNLQADAVRDCQHQEVFLNSQRRIAALSIVHEILYEQERFSNLSVRDYLGRLLNSLISFINDSGETIEVRSYFDDINLFPDQAVIFGLLVNELVTNSIKILIKHPGPKKINIELIKNSETFYLLVKDSGPGFPVPFYPEELETLGIKLILALSEQIEGKVSFYNENGAVVKIQWKPQTC